LEDYIPIYQFLEVLEVAVEEENNNRIVRKQSWK